MTYTKTVLSMLLLLASCAADGGSRGSGVTTAQGNVATIENAASRERRPPTLIARLRELLPIPGAAAAQGELEGIRVEVEGTEFVDRTDSNGVFAVRGTYGGPIALRFRRDDGIDARLLADVPFGGVITLSNVRLRSGSGDATAERHEVDFEGVVTGTNCQADTITVRAGDGRTYTVHLNGTLRADDGTPIGCGALSGGEEIEIEGVVNPDGTIDAFEAELESDSSGSGGGDGDDDSSGSDGGDSSGSGGGDD